MTNESEQNPEIINPDSVVQVQKHKFKRHEWFVTRQALIERLRRYKREFLISWVPTVLPWKIKNIWHFLELFPELYPGFPQEHHMRCIATIVFEGGLD